MSTGSVTPPPVPFGSINCALNLAMESLYHLTTFCGQATSACMHSSYHGNIEDQLLHRLARISESATMILLNLKKGTDVTTNFDQVVWSRYLMLLRSIFSSCDMKCLLQDNASAVAAEEHEITEQSCSTVGDGYSAIGTATSDSTSSAASSSGAPEYSPPLPTLSFMYYDDECNGLEVVGASEDMLKPFCTNSSCYLNDADLDLALGVLASDHSTNRFVKSCTSDTSDGTGWQHFSVSSPCGVIGSSSQQQQQNSDSSFFASHALAASLTPSTGWAHHRSSDVAEKDIGEIQATIASQLRLQQHRHKQVSVNKSWPVVYPVEVTPSSGSVASVWSGQVANWRSTPPLNAESADMTLQSKHQTMSSTTHQLSSPYFSQSVSCNSSGNTSVWSANGNSAALLPVSTNTCIANVFTSSATEVSASKDIESVY